MTYNNRVAFLRRRLREMESAVVAFSGGVDSAVLVFLAHQELKDKMCAATALSPSIPSRDRLIAASFCRERKIPHHIVETNEFDDPNYTANPKDRCFYCKHALYESFNKLANEKGFKYIIEGTNASDLKGHRPGYRASQERKNVATPLVDAVMTKDDVRRLARDLNLPLAGKPSSACLSSRVASGVRLTPELLKRIDDAEEFIRSCGMTQVRVRHHLDLARIEIDPSEFPQFLENRERVKAALEKLGYKFVTLDIIGYHTGGTAG